MAGVSDPAQRSSITLPDGRSLDVWQAGPPDGDRGSITGGLADYLAANSHEALREGYLGWLDDELVFAWPWGFDLALIRCPVHIWQGEHDRMVPYGHGAWLAGHVPTACPHLYAEHGHLTLVVDTFGQILDELLAGGG